jgi:DNA-binding CsgD family transcriptional regulator
MKFGWLTLDAHCCIVDMDAHAEAFLGNANVLQRTLQNRLAASRPAIDRQIVGLVRSFAQSPQTARLRIISLSSDPWIEMVLAPVRAQPVSAGSTPTAIAYLKSDEWSSAERCEQLIKLFGLLPSEARLAWAMTRGMALPDAPQELGIKRETARSYAKSIYGKLDARGQADLVRTILTSLRAIA